MTYLFQETMASLSGLEGPTRETYEYGCSKFMEDVYNGLRCSSSHPGMRRPSFSPFQNTTDEMFSVVVRLQPCTPKPLS